MRTRSVSLCLAVTLAASVFAVAASANAGSDKADEGAGDVSTIDNIGQPLPSAQSVNVDVVRHSVKHAKHAVKIKATYADLSTPTNGDEITLSTDLKVKGGGKFTFNVGSDGSHPAGLTYFFKPGTAGPAPCKGMSVKFDYSKNTVTAKLPRTCLGSPAWVRYASRASFDDAADNYFFDLIGTAGTKKAPFSPQLAVG